MGKTKEVSNIAGDFSPNISKGESEWKEKHGFQMTHDRKKMNKSLSGTLTETISSVTLRLTPLFLNLAIYPSSLHFSITVNHFITLSHVR